MKVYSSFIEFYNMVLVPLKKNNSNFVRLDGNLSGGNPAPFAYFRYQNKTWQINADSHLYRIEEVYNLFQKGKDPFVEVDSNQKKRRCLSLKEYNGYKHLYIYEVKR